jgi:DNA-binding transcriptional regulator GbsR (MarR family)
MTLPQKFLPASAGIATSVYRAGRTIRQMNDLCERSRREVDASYELLRKVQRSLGESPKAKSATQSTESHPKKQQALLT